MLIRAGKYVTEVGSEKELFLYCTVFVLEKTTCGTTFSLAGRV